MSTSVTFNGSSYIVPAIGDASWGSNVSNYLIALSTGSLQKTGGAFTLSAADVIFGGTYGLQAIYFKSNTASLAQSGVLRLARADVIAWRNAAGNADIALSVNGSNALQYNSISLADISSAQTLTNKTIDGGSNTLTNLPATGLAGIVGAANGGTGVANNAASTLTISGSFGTTLTVSATTTATLQPTTGVIVGRTTTDTLTNKTLTSPAITTPTGLVKGDVGLGNVDNTSDATKNAASVTLTNKTLTSPVINTPTGIVKGDVGLGSVDNTSDATKNAAAVTLTNKTLTAPVQSSYEDFTEISTPATPSAGVLRLYSKSGDNMFTKNSSGTETQLGSGSGQKNYLQAGSSSTTSWNAIGTVAVTNDTTSADLPRANTTKQGIKFTPSGTTATFTCTSAAPGVATATAHGMQTGYIVTLTNSGGGLPSGLSAATPYWVNVVSANTFNFATSMANLIAGTYVTTASTGTGTQTFAMGVATYLFTLDAADYNVKQQLQWAQNILSGAAGDWEVDVYSNTVGTNSGGQYTAGTTTRLPLSTDTSGGTLLPNLEGTFRTTFDAPGSAAQYIEVRVQRANANTHALVLSDVVVGPGVTVQGAALSEPIAFTPTGSWSTNTTYTGQYWRTGSRVRCYVKIALAGAPTAASLTINMPSGLTINSSVVDTTTLVSNYGSGSGNPAGTTSNFQVVSNGSTGSVGVLYQSSTTAGQTAVDATHPGTWANTNVLEVWWEVPTNEWAGSGTVNVAQNDLQYYYSTGNTWGTSNGSAATSQGQGGVLGGTTTPSNTGFAYTFVPTTPIPVGTSVWIETSSDQIHWTRGSNNGPLPFFLENLRYDGTNFIGAAASVLANGNIRVDFGKYPCGVTSNAWTGTWYWRVCVGLPGQAIGFGQVVPGTSAGLVAAAGLPGSTTGTALAAGYVGEYIEHVSTGNTSITTATATDVDSTGITLTPGIWDITGSMQYTPAASTSITALSSWIGTATGNSTTGQDVQRNYSEFATAANVTTAIVSTLTLPTFRVNISSNTTYYLKAKATFTVSTLTANGLIRATRIA